MDRQHAAWGGMRHGSPSPGGQAPLCKVQSYLCVSASGMRRNAWRHQSGLLAFIRPVPSTFQHGLIDTRRPPSPARC